MADSTITVDTGEWEYVDVYGIGHFVADGETFTMTVTDGGASTVSYNIPVAQSITTTDGYTLYFRPEVDGGNVANTIGYLTDAAQGTDLYNVRGELPIECPVSGIIQRWKVATIAPSDADFGSAGTLDISLEDQFGNTMSFSGVTVGQAGA